MSGLGDDGVGVFGPGERRATVVPGAIIVFQWLEALGFCGLGESGSFVEAGNTRLGGSLPVNTDGGACNVGRRHGANFCIESIRQLRGGESGDRQVPNAEVAVWANAVGPFSGAMLMTSA
jgi:acetyl-CoA acetyltransferase